MFGRRALLLLSISHTACGRIDFGSHATGDATGDATDDAAGMRAIPELVHVRAGASSTQSITLSIPPTAAGHFLLVGIVSYNVNSVTSIVDDAANAYTSANARAIITAGGATEIWFARTSQPNATQVVVTISGPGLESWFAEFSGIDANPIDARATSDLSAGATVIAPSVTTTSPNSMVVSVGAIVNGATGIHAGSPFLSLGIPNGDIAAFYVAPVPGSYGAVFDETSNGLACASSAAFAAALQ